MLPVLKITQNKVYFSPTRKKSSRPSSKADNVAVADDTFMTSLYKEFSDMSTRLNNDTDISFKDNESGADDDDDVLPQAAANMGSGNGILIKFISDEIFRFIDCILT